MSRSILFGIHSIFPPPHITNHNGQDPISEKKLKQLEGLWQTKKEILGWDFDGKAYTIQLPPEKEQKLQNLINNTYRKKAVQLKSFQKLQGKLVHASMGMPNGRGLLAPIYKATKFEHPMVTITREVKEYLKDWKQMAKQLTTTPTSILRLVPDKPHYIGYVDASKEAVGGVWTNGLKQLPQQYVWRIKWPKDIQNNLVSRSNPKGKISINDLEMVGVLLAWLILEKITKS